VMCVARRRQETPVGRQDHIAWGRRNFMTTKRHSKKMARELPPVGTTLQGRFKGETRTATMVSSVRFSRHVSRSAQAVHSRHLN